ncbi:hypothetical protein BN7_5040 [Wickerhamomyces ciferrii]|uniref:Protein kinase domain-containing protein n=1 Tax=Wickerhamomyces ciferrii (strain ATCC 14091 / BCRC 22168 / CBS 111 / JCM 3599 / NBRC 0793 / NRRL Y-1031 F-60-10) TaxID=1206466 RepID=K0KWC3_WICCF|nr:uncharacterized protein BN7_5040 [Wickerhamomyces ciferrii]CCH45458.1 hypothetical protein BN7_5040 [Wickerhamomyces ciferrii]
MIAIDEIKYEFCILGRESNFKIVKRLGLKKDEKPKFFNSLWKIFFAAPIVYDKFLSGSETDDKENIDNLSIFNHAFKSIRFQSIKEIKDDEFLRNIKELELVIQYSLNKMGEREVKKGIESLLGSLSTYGRCISIWDQDIRYRSEVMESLIMEPMFRFIHYLFSIDDEYHFHYDKYDQMINKTKPSWEFSKLLPENKDDNFAKLSRIFREVVPFQIFSKFNSYIISNFNNSLYFEYPLKDGEWESDNDEEVILDGAPVRYKLFDNGANPADSISLQLLLMLKIYDTIRKELCTDSWLKDSNGNDLLTTDETADPIGYIVQDPRKIRSSKRLKIKRELESIKIFDPTKLFPTNVSLQTSNYELLEEYSYFHGIKLKIESSDIFKSNNSNISNKVFFKMFDLANLKYLQWYRYIVGTPSYKKDAKIFTQSEINVLSTIDYEYVKDFNWILEVLKESYIKEITALKRINHWNSTHGKDDQINSPRLLQYGWTYLELLSSKGEVEYSYWGSFICTEYLEFIKDDQYEKNSKREKNLKKQIEILSKAGIDHNDIKADNYCFDEFDNAYLVDYGECIIDENRYLEGYDLEKIDPDEKWL